MFLKMFRWFHFKVLEHELEQAGMFFLKGERVKNGGEYFLPWLPLAQTIANKYNYELPLVTNQKYNAYLKEIAEITELQKKITTLNHA